MEGTCKRQQADHGDEIYLQIFSRLSTADLGRCNCVCRDWRRLVRGLLSGELNLAFALIVQTNVWFPRFYSFSGGFLRDDTFPSFDAALTPSGRLKSQVLVACNGMVLLCIGYPPYTSRRSYLRIGRPDHRRTVDEITDYVLLNPITGKASTIPPPPCGGVFNFLVFDPSSSSHHFMLLTLRFFRPSTPEPYLYSSPTGEWRRLDAERISALPQDMTWGRDDCHCINNVAYKIAGFSYSSSSNASEYHLWVNIMAFDVNNECLFWVNSPVMTNNTIGTGYHFIGSSAGRLAFAHLDHNKCLFMWALNDCHTGDWSFKHKINLNDVPFLKGRLSILAFHPVDGDLVFVSISDHLLLANLRTLEVRELLQGEEFLDGSLFPYFRTVTM